jgi:YegS/Rv2252/BmrU family lipid kinase
LNIEPVRTRAPFQPGEGLALRVIQNPAAGRGRQHMFDRVLRRLRGLGAAVTVVRTQAPGDAEALARAAAAEGCARVVAAGGDGTINEVINGLSGSQVALGIVPLGTANVLAQEIGLTRDPDRIAAAIAGGALRRVSLGRVVSEAGRGRHFTLMAGVGFDAHVVADVDLALKRRIGKGAYVAEFARQLFAFKFPTYRVVVDGATHEAASVVIAKARYYGGPYSCAKDARLEDTEFHVCLFERPGALAAVRYGIALTGGRLEGRGDYRILRAAHVRVEGPAGDPVQGDGDVIAALPLAVEMAPAALRLIVPN